MAAVWSASISFVTWVTCWEQLVDVKRRLGLDFGDYGLGLVQGVGIVVDQKRHTFEAEG